MRIDVVSIFPEYLAALDLSLIGKARRENLLDLNVHDLRDYTHDRHRTVDDTPYGGGAGMVMKPEPWAAALNRIATESPVSGELGEKPILIVPSPAGAVFDQEMAYELAEAEHLAFACGRYEGIDERVLEYAAGAFDVRPVSIGDYVLNGGEVAVLAMVEAIGRLIPGVIGNPESLVEESHSDGLLEYPVYTKPGNLGGPRGPRGAALGQPRQDRTLPPQQAAGAHGNPAPGLDRAAGSRHAEPPRPRHAVAQRLRDC